MCEFKYLKQLDTMERITREELCAEFDNILERVDKENIGFIILNDEGKDGYVLCPARWSDYCFDDDFGCIVNGALRYAIRSHTHMPSVVVNFVRKYINVLDTKTIDLAIKDIEYDLEHNNVDNPGIWSALLSDLKTRFAFLCENKGLIEKQESKKDK